MCTCVRTIVCWGVCVVLKQGSCEAEIINTDLRFYKLCNRVHYLHDVCIIECVGGVCIIECVGRVCIIEWVSLSVKGEWVGDSD